MGCKHTAIRCTNNRFFCLLCGAEIEPPKAEKPPKPKKPAKDTAKKEEKNANG